MVKIILTSFNLNHSLVIDKIHSIQFFNHFKLFFLLPCLSLKRVRFDSSEEIHFKELSVFTLVD